VFISESEVRCVTPQRNGPGTAHITASNDGAQYSGYPLIYTKGSGGTQILNRKSQILNPKHETLNPRP